MRSRLAGRGLSLADFLKAILACVRKRTNRFCNERLAIHNWLYNGAGFLPPPYQDRLKELFGGLPTVAKSILGRPARNATHKRCRRGNNHLFLKETERRWVFYKKYGRIRQGSVSPAIAPPPEAGSRLWR